MDASCNTARPSTILAYHRHDQYTAGAKSTSIVLTRLFQVLSLTRALLHAFYSWNLCITTTVSVQCSCAFNNSPHKMNLQTTTIHAYEQLLNAIHIHIKVNMKMHKVKISIIQVCLLGINNFQQNSCIIKLN